ncbi:MAG: TIGR04211 family SH3 domain-containing protein [Thermodesulfobacteria bacterium]|nr:TIGR04211 family SH3 domain-containing protein [Thermodesulfobacteriota bacterium]
MGGKNIVLNVVVTIFFIICNLLIIGEVNASTYYVAPSSEVPLRTGTNTSKKIVAVLKDGTRVDLLKEEGPWAYVRTAGGREGWILKRYLTQAPPPKMMVEKLRQRNEKLVEECKKLKDQLRELSTTGSKCSQKLAACLANSQKLASDFEALKRDASNVIQTKKLLAETQKKLQLLNTERLKLKQRLNSLEANTNIKWFLAGGGVLLIGWILGIFTTKRKKRRPSLL